jgi:type VI secretion system secreted protein Hcp
MAFDAFIKLSTIPGESTDDKHKDWIEVLSFSHGLAQHTAGAVSATGGHTGGRVDIAELSFVHGLDKASPKLALACCTGEHIPEVKMELCKAGGTKELFMEYKFTDVVVSSVRPGGSSTATGAVPLEEVSIAFGKISWKYSVIDYKTGRVSGNVATGWDLQKNSKC